MSLYPEIAEKQAEQEDSNIEEVTKKFKSAVDDKNYGEALRFYQVIYDLIAKHLHKNPRDAEGYQTTIDNLHNLLIDLHKEQGAGQGAGQAAEQGAGQAAEQEGAGNKRKKRKSKQHSEKSRKTKSKKSKKSNKSKKSRRH